MFSTVLKNTEKRLTKGNKLEELVRILGEQKLKLSAAESCTGGLFMNLITDVPGSSRVFECGFVTYSNDSKINILAVNPHTLGIKGVVSEETVSEMLDGLLAETLSDVLCAVSGIAGPDGGSKEKPVGTVYAGFCLRKKGLRRIKHYFFEGDRKTIKKKTAEMMGKDTVNFLKEVFNC